MMLDRRIAASRKSLTRRSQKFPYPSVEAIKTALDMLSDEYPQAKSVDPHEVADLSFVKQVESGALR